MATIIHLRDYGQPSTTKREERTLTLLVGSMLVALSAISGAPAIGLAVAGLFCCGMLLARVEGRLVSPSEYTAIAMLHALAVIVLTF